MKMHDMHLYLRYTNSYVLLSDWRTVVRETQFFHNLVSTNRKGTKKLGFSKGAEKMGGVMENLKIVGEAHNEG